jgi:hypothetical protein
MMEHLIEDLIDRMVAKRKQELENLEKYKECDLKDLILFSSGKITEQESIIENLKETLTYHMKFKSVK